MSIKSTQTVSRTQAINGIKDYYEGYIENKSEIDRIIEDTWEYSDDYLEWSKRHAKRIYDGHYNEVSNYKLEDIMQCMADLMAFGESFNNYIVEED